MEGKEPFVNPTKAGRSKKAHIPRPVRALLPHLGTKRTPDRDSGQFTAEGGAGLEKK